MKCRKQLVLTGYRVQFVDLREPKPRTPREEIHVMDRQWLDALGLLGQNVTGNIRELYERNGYKVFAVEPIKPRRVAESTFASSGIRRPPMAPRKPPPPLTARRAQHESDSRHDPHWSGQQSSS